MERNIGGALGNMEEAITALERRGINLKTHSERMNFETGRLPVFHLVRDNQEHWFTSRKEMDEYLKQQEEETGQELTIKSEGDSAGDNENDEPEEDRGTKILITEFHEVRTINTGLKDIEVFGFTAESLMPVERTGIEEPRFVLRRGENTTSLHDLRSLPPAIRTAGEKGMSVTRFKGLGEMNAEELRETTLDPDNRTLIQVKMTNAADADDMFRILMGDKVEPRREFIEKHALEVKNLDI